ncbi:hypothetical protein GA0071314_3497 [Halomonas sp. HL-93]|nr:hypothetical protein GA0071314_3497 [Halomonas sp. HL-93]
MRFIKRNAAGETVSIKRHFELLTRLVIGILFLSLMIMIAVRGLAEFPANKKRPPAR